MPLTDAGIDAGQEDAGPPDSGSTDEDAGIDAGAHDAGTLPDAGTRRCLGVACIGDTTCSPEDGQCRCGGFSCGVGQTCTCPGGSPGCGPTERVCENSSRCDATTCTNGSSCDLFDGQCKCPGPGGPACTDVQFCGAARPPQCVGVCTQTCDRGMSCDADDSTCKCGGRGGDPCNDGEVCVSTATQYACRLSCVPGESCPADQACFIDTQPSFDVAYCAYATGLRGEGTGCTLPTQCFDGHPLHCAGLSAQVPVGTCREACDPSAAQCPAGRHCEGLPDVRDAGFCVP